MKSICGSIDIMNHSKLKPVELAIYDFYIYDIALILLSFIGSLSQVISISSGCYLFVCLFFLHCCFPMLRRIVREL